MPSKLEAIEGPPKGEVFLLPEGEATVGRDPSSTIAVLDSLLSRRHFSIRPDGRHFLLRDLDSRNHTYVDGEQVGQRELKGGEHIRAGKCTFVFISGTAAGDETAAEDETAADAEDEQLRGSTVMLRSEDALYLKPSSEIAPGSASARVLSDLNALLRISKALNSVQSLDALESKLVESIAEVTPADRAAIVLAGSGWEEFSSGVGWDRKYGRGQGVQVSHTIVRRVLKDGVAILNNDVPGMESLQGADSLVAPRVRSVLAVPLQAFQQIHGAIYLDASSPGARFDENHLQLLTAIGSIAATALATLRHIEDLESENQRLQAEINIEHDMVGEGPAIREVFQFIERVAQKESTVLISGESGTGKELVARAIHNNSNRAVKPFVAINCAAITETLLESELFGHEKGAFTGAVAQKRGKLEVAEGGTVFLDEIGELAPALQAKLLRVLQEREFERVGGTRPIHLDIRLIAATNRDLQAAAKAGTFRPDLYYRLNVVSVRMPALRDRREDIPLLAAYFASKHAAKTKRLVTGISPAARYCLMDYDWPGNVRELENAIEHAVVLGTTDQILPEDLPEAVLDSAPKDAASVAKFHEGVREAKKQLILKALDQAEGSYTEAAKLLGVHPNYLHRLITNLSLRTRRQRQG